MLAPLAWGTYLRWLVAGGDEAWWWLVLVVRAEVVGGGEGDGGCGDFGGNIQIRHIGVRRRPSLQDSKEYPVMGPELPCQITR